MACGAGNTLYVVQGRLNQVSVISLDADGTSGVLVDTLTSMNFDVPTTVAAFGNSLLFAKRPVHDLTRAGHGLLDHRIDRR